MLIILFMLLLIFEYVLFGMINCVVMWENAFALVVWICNAYVIGRELWKHLARAEGWESKENA